MKIKGIEIIGADVVAVVVFICATILKLSGCDGTVSLIMATIVAYYFGKQYRVMKCNK